MNKPLIRRLWTIAAVLVVLQGGAYFLLQRAKSSEVRDLHHDLSELPYDIGDFHGKDQVLDEELTTSVGARESLGRLYQNAAGFGISLHMADWDSLKHPTLPHPPSICYVASGAQIIRREPIEVGESTPIKAELMVVERKGVRTVILYWYSWNEIVCTTRAEACMARLKMVGSREWPPVVKVLLDTPSVPTESEALKRLTEFAAEVRDLTKDL